MKGMICGIFLFEALDVWDSTIDVWFTFILYCSDQLNGVQAKAFFISDWDEFHKKVQHSRDCNR